MGQSYTFLDHPADLGIEARGTSAAGAFEQAARGLIAVLVDPGTIRPTVSRVIDVSGDDMKQLLVRWLSELLYLYDAEHFIAGEISITSFTDRRLIAAVTGEQYEPPRPGARTDVKAVTYHQLALAGDADGFTVRFYLDI